jgi:N-glycosidase YbiA
MTSRSPNKSKTYDVVPSGDCIKAFRGANAFLSNFHPSPIHINDIVYPTVEHAFQAQKTVVIEVKRKIAALPTAKQAKAFGGPKQKNKKNIPDFNKVSWDVRRIHTMRWIVKRKFQQNLELQKLLIATHPKPLYEVNTWRDRYWGLTKGADGLYYGENHLGEILMDVREELRDAAIERAKFKDVKFTDIGPAGVEEAMHDPYVDNIEYTCSVCGEEDIIAAEVCMCVCVCVCASRDSFHCSNSNSMRRLSCHCAFRVETAATRARLWC